MFKVRLPGCAFRDSSAPPITMTDAWPPPSLLSTCETLSLDAETIPSGGNIFRVTTGSSCTSTVEFKNIFKHINDFTKLKQHRKDFKGLGSSSSLWNRFGFGHMLWLHWWVQCCCLLQELWVLQGVLFWQLNSPSERLCAQEQQVHTNTGTERLTACMEDLLTQTWSYSAKQIPPLFSQL